MKIKKWKLAVSVIFSVFLLSACGAKEETEMADNKAAEEELDREEEEENEEMDGTVPGEESGTRESEPELPSEPEPELEPELEPAPEPLPDWAVEYRNFLAERENLVPLLLEPGEGGLTGFIDGFCLYDINGDEVPELFVHKEKASYYVYTYTGTQMELRNVIYDDAFEEFYFGYSPKDGQVYSATLDAGTGTDRLTGLSKLELLEEARPMGETVGISVQDGRQRLYSAVFGSIECADGSYMEVDWEDAIPYENNSISTEEFKEIWKNFVPFEFQQISEENIENYIVPDYMDKVEPGSLEACKKKRDDRWIKFREQGLPGDVEDGTIIVPDTMRVTEDMLGDKSLCFYDLGLLACYNERSLVFGTEKEQSTMDAELISTDKDRLKQVYQAYYGYLEKIIDNSFAKCQFIYLDNDDIPEIYVDGLSAAENYSWLIYYNHAGAEVEYGIDKYMERDGLFHAPEGKQGAYGDTVQRLDNGEIKLIGAGDYAVKAEYHESDGWYHLLLDWWELQGNGKSYDANSESNKSMNTMFEFEWNGEAVTFEEYGRRFDEIFNSAEAVKLSWDDPDLISVSDMCDQLLSLINQLAENE